MALDWQAQQARLNARLSDVFGVDATRYAKKGASVSSASIRVVLDENIQASTDSSSNIETRFMTGKTILSFISADWPAPRRGDYVKIGERRFDLDRPVSNDGLAVWVVTENDS
ncbi:MAG: hypothetical protein V7731_01800 [Amphritea sp.]